MEEFPNEKEVPFNNNDIAILEERRSMLKVSAIAGCIILPAIAVTGIQFLLESESKLQIQISAAIALVAFTLLLSRRDIRNLDGHIKNGKKTVIQGEITRQHNRGGTRSSNIYYLSIEQIEVRVPREIYQQYKVGDKAEFHIYKPLYNLLLYQEKWPSKG